MYIKKISLLALIIFFVFISFAYALELYPQTITPLNNIKLYKDFTYFNIQNQAIGIDLLYKINSKPLIPVTAIIDEAVTSSLKAKQSA